MSLLEFRRRKSFRFYILLVILALQGHQCETKRFLDIYATLLSYTVPKESDAFLQLNCSLPSIAEMPRNGTAMSKLKTHPAIYLSGIFAYDIIDAQGHVNISIERSGRYDTYLSTTVDFCKMRYAKIEQPFVRYMRNGFIRVAKPNADCPLKKNILYELNNLVVSNKFLQPFWPQLNWKVNIQFWLNGRYSHAVAVIGKIEWINI